MDVDTNLHVAYSSDDEVIVISDEEAPPKKQGCKVKIMKKVRGKSPQ